MECYDSLTNKDINDLLCIAKYGVMCDGLAKIRIKKLLNNGNNSKIFRRSGSKANERDKRRED